MTMAKNVWERMTGSIRGSKRGSTANGVRSRDGLCERGIPGTPMVRRAPDDAGRSPHRHLRHRQQQQRAGPARRISQSAPARWRRVLTERPEPKAPDRSLRSDGGAVCDGCRDRALLALRAAQSPAQALASNGRTRRAEDSQRTQRRRRPQRVACGHLAPPNRGPSMTQVKAHGGHMNDFSLWREGSGLPARMYLSGMVRSGEAP